MTDLPNAITASQAPPRTRPSNYPEPFASRMAGRIKHPLGDIFGLKNFGVNLTRLRPGDEVGYPSDDIKAVMGDDGRWRFAHKNGEPY